ncbi:MAG: hypothetical protein JWO32_394 [Bacteroidetes bacterium]|nr:hypothetical protein [Bacteroidota bacterium]
MSSHFNYEIDEQNLRGKLKEYVLPGKEEMWTQFENFSDLNRSGFKSSALPSFNININRTLILPFVFGGVVILFSLLLFNFISIKNKNLANSIKQPLMPVKKTQSPLPSKPSKQLIAAKINSDSLPGSPALTSATSLPKVPSPTVQAINNLVLEPKEENKWVTTQGDKIYSNPNIASTIIGSTGINQTYNSIEETNYFVKIFFIKDNKSETGFIRKSALRKSGSTPQTGGDNIITKRKNRKAEVLESIQTPVMLSGSSGAETEPELK